MMVAPVGSSTGHVGTQKNETGDWSAVVRRTAMVAGALAGGGFMAAVVESSPLVKIVSSVFMGLVPVTPPFWIAAGAIAGGTVAYGIINNKLS